MKTAIKPDKRIASRILRSAFNAKAALKNFGKLSSEEARRIALALIEQGQTALLLRAASDAYFQIPGAQREENLLDLSSVNFNLAKDAFSYQQLSGVDLRRITCEAADFQGAQLLDIKLDGAHLPDAYFTRATAYSQDIGVSLRGACLEHASFDQTYFQRADFSGAFLNNSNFNRSNCAGAAFSGADLRNASFKYADLGHATFAGANLEDADFTGADCRAAIFACAQLKGVKGLAPKQMESARVIEPA